MIIRITEDIIYEETCLKWMEIHNQKYSASVRYLFAMFIRVIENEIGH